MASMILTIMIMLTQINDNKKRRKRKILLSDSAAASRIIHQYLICQIKKKSKILIIVVQNTQALLESASQSLLSWRHPLYLIPWQAPVCAQKKAFFVVMEI